MAHFGAHRWHLRFWRLGVILQAPGAPNRSNRRAAAHKVGQQAWSKPNLTHLGFACQVWVLSWAFLAFRGGAESFHNVASEIALRSPFGAILWENKAQGFNFDSTEPQAQIWRDAQAPAPL